MLGLRSQSININRQVLIEKLKEGLETHKIEYEEALLDYKAAVVKFMQQAYFRASSGDFTDLVLKFTPPVLHESEYTNIIELLSYSVDENINLDADAFRSYVKGEWSWKNQFDLTSKTIKAYLA